MSPPHRLENAVGYSKPTLPSGLSNSGVVFMNCDGTDVDLQEIVPYKGDIVAPDSESFLMRWFNSGKYDYATWYAEGDLYPDGQGEVGDDEEPLEFAGWGDAETCRIILNKKFAPGHWFLIQPVSVTKPSIQVAGALVSADQTKPTYVMDLVSGLQSAGNPFPVACDIQTITPMKGTVVAPDSESFLMRWYNGGKYDYATWYAEGDLYPEGQGEVGDDEDPLEFAGWGDAETCRIISKVFYAGEGFLIQPVSVSNPKLAFPNPLYSVED